MTTFHYTRLDRWRPTNPTQGNGWTSDAVAARFEAGTRGEHYLEHVCFGPRMATEPAARELLDMLDRTGLACGVLLDFGCGNGIVRELLAAARPGRWSYIGVDVNARHVESCRHRYPDSRFEVVAGNAPLPLEDASVDLALACGVLEFTPDPTVVLQDLRRVSRAWVALCRLGIRPGAARPAVYRQRVEHAWGVEEHCFHVFSRQGLDAMIADADLEIAWEQRSTASGEWIAPDNPDPLRHYSLLLKPRTRT